MAEKDLAAVKGMTDEEIFADEIFGLHVQQSVEKGLKAWAALKGLEYPFRHDLAELLDLLAENGCDVRQFSDLVQYTAFAVQFRYEEIDPSLIPLNRKVIAQRIETLLKHVESQLDKN